MIQLFKTFLSHAETKKELTAYLSHKLRKEYVVVYDTVCKSNKFLPPTLYHHDQGEADTLLILYGIDVVENEPFRELIVC